MTKNLANLSETLRAIDDINADIKKVERYINFTPDGAFEIEGKEAYTNVLGRLLTMRHALEKKRGILEKN